TTLLSIGGCSLIPARWRTISRSSSFSLVSVGFIRFFPSPHPATAPALHVHAPAPQLDATVSATPACRECVPDTPQRGCWMLPYPAASPARHLSWRTGSGR